MNVNAIPTETLTDIADYVHSKWTEFKNSEKRTKKVEAVKRAREAYLQEVKDTDFPWKGASNLIVPITAISVDQLEPRLAAAIVGREEMIVIDDIGKHDKVEGELIVKFDNAVLRVDVKLHEAVKDWVHNVLVDGQVYLMPYWSFREMKTRQYIMDPMGQPVPAAPEDQESLMGFQTEEVLTTLTDGVKVVEIPLESLFFPERIDDWEEVPVIRGIWLAIGNLKRHITNGDRGWVHLPESDLEALSQQAYTKRPSEDMILLEPDTEEKVPDRGSSAQNLKAELSCLEGHISYDLDGDGFEERLIVIIERDTRKILYIINNNTIDPLNRKAIQPWLLIKDPNTGYGKSLHEKLKEIERGATTLFNTLINSAMVQMIPWFFYESGAGFLGQVLDLIPGKGNPISDVKKIYFPNISPNAASFKDFLEIFLGLWERIVAVSDYTMGRESDVAGNRATATGTLALIQESAISHEYLGSGLQDRFTKILEIIHDLYYLNTTEQRVLEIMGQPCPRVLSKNYRFRLAASTKSANKHIERKELEEAMVVAEKGVALGIVDPVPVIRDWLKTFKDIDLDEWMNGPIAQIVQRLTQPQEPGGVPDPFPKVVMTMMKQNPVQLLTTIKNVMDGAGSKPAQEPPPGGPPA